MRTHHVQAGAGHYGVFSGRRRPGQIHPIVRDASRASQSRRGLLRHWQVALLRASPSRADTAMTLETWELLSYVVTVVGLPLAILVFLYEQRKERENEEEEVYQLLSDNYQDFLKVALAHPDLQLFSSPETEGLTGEQRERMVIMFSMLVSLFERAYLLLYEEEMAEKQQRRWRSWEDYMREWCSRRDFRTMLPQLLSGEDPQFADYIQRVAAEEAGERGRGG